MDLASPETTSVSCQDSTRSKSQWEISRADFSSARSCSMSAPITAEESEKHCPQPQPQPLQSPQLTSFPPSDSHAAISTIQDPHFIEMRTRLLSFNWQRNDVRAPSSVVEAIAWLWRYSFVQSLWMNRKSDAKLSVLPSSIAFFFDRCESIFASSYEPSFDDYLKVYQETAGSHDMILEMPLKRVSCLFHDVCTCLVSFCVLCFSVRSLPDLPCFTQLFFLLLFN